MKGILDLFKKLFGVGFQLQTYLNLVYLTLALPLGIVYFVALTVGFTTGLGTSVILVGVFILLLTLALAWALAAVERGLAIWLLRVNIGPMGRQPQAPGLWYWLQSYLGNPFTWSGLLYLFLKLPIGVVTFSVTITLLSLSVALLAAPFAYAWLPLSFLFWRIDTLAAALMLFIVGLVATAVSLHLLNLLAAALGRWAQMALGGAAPAPSSRPAEGGCLLPCAAVVLFACAAVSLCSIPAWLTIASRPGAEPAVATAIATPLGAVTPRPSATPSLPPTATLTPTLPAATATATETETSIPPTATQPTMTPSATASLTLTPAPTFTPTSAGPDPMANAGPVLFDETFAPAKYYWGTGEGAFSRIDIGGGALNVVVRRPKHVVWTFSGAPTRPDFCFSGVVTATACFGGDNFGLVFRAKDDRSLFLYGVSCDGHYQLAQYVDGTLHQLIDPAESTAILPGPGAANLLGVRAVGKELDLYANGQFLIIAATDAAGKGMFGVYAASAQTAGLTAAFSQLKAWQVGP